MENETLVRKETLVSINTHKQEIEPFSSGAVNTRRESGVQSLNKNEARPILRASRSQPIIHPASQ